MEANNQTTKTQNNQSKQLEFKKLSDLTNEDVKKLAKHEVTFTRTPKTVKPGAIALNDNVSINVKIHTDFLKSISLRPGGDYLSVDRFELIQFSINLPIKDDNDKPNKIWIKNVPIRFVKGKYEDGTEYLSMEVIYKQFLYDTHFFTSDQVRIIEVKEADGIKLPWVERPDKIAKASVIEDVQF